MTAVKDNNKSITLKIIKIYQNTLYYLNTAFTDQLYINMPSTGLSRFPALKKTRGSSWKTPGLIFKEGSPSFLSTDWQNQSL